MITEAIIKEAQAGSSEAFAVIYNETVRTAYYVAKRILLDDDATEDVLQESYIAVFKNLPNYQAGNLQGWIDTIVANRAKNYLRTKNPILFSEMETEEKPVVEFEEERIEFRPDEKMDYSETQRLILEIVDNLSPDQRLSVMLFYFEDKSVKEIAEICECSENTVKSRLNYARKKIKEDVLELEKKGTKLYSVSIIPFIIWMLSEKAKACPMPQAMASKIYNSVNGTLNIMGSTVVDYGTNAVASANMNAGTNVVANATAASVAGKTGMAIGAKIGIAAATVAAVVGIGIGVVMFGGKDDSGKDANKKTEYSSGISGEISSENGDAAGEEMSTDKGNDGNGPIEILGGGNYKEESGKDSSRIFVNGYGTIKVDDEVYGTITKGYYIYISGEGYGLKHLDGRTIIEPGTYEELTWIDSYGDFDTSDRVIHTIILAKGKDGYGVINAEGEIIIPLEYESIEHIEVTKLDETSYYRIICNKTNSSGDLVSIAYRDDGTKIFELTGEAIDKLRFDRDDFLYEKRDESGQVVAWISTKSGETLFDYARDGIDNVFMLGYSADIAYTDGTRKYVAFNEDYTSYVFTSAELTNDFSVLKTSKIYGFYKYFDKELDFYVDNQLAKSITGVDKAWVCDDKIYYLASTYENDEYIQGVYDEEGIILSSKNYELYYEDVLTKRYMVIRPVGEMLYQLYDLVNKEVVVTDIVNAEKLDGGSYHYTLQLEGERCVSIWKNKKIVYHDSNWKLITVCDEYMLLQNYDNTVQAIADLQGNITFQFNKELHQIDYVRQLVLDVSGSTRAYYNFKGELVYEIEK